MEFRVRRVTTAAAAIMKQSLAGAHDRFGLLARLQPALVSLRLHNHHATDHSRVLRSAILRTEDAVLARPRRLEPLARIFSRDDILFYPKSRHEKTVNHVLGSQSDRDGTIDRDV